MIYRGERRTFSLELAHSKHPINLAIVVQVAWAINLVAKFWEYGSAFDSVDVVDVEPPERFGFSGTVVCRGSVENARARVW
jgi:hypothetical protein